MNATAVIADDEDLPRAELRRMLAAAWPELQVVAECEHGAAAVEAIDQHEPDIAFLDIRMPGLSGLDAAVELADAWPADHPFPALVFVTAYDQYAVQAFEAQAVDYLLKPVQSARLQKTVQKLQKTLSNKAPAAITLEASVAQLRQLLAATAPPAGVASALPGAPLSLLQVSHGTEIHIVPVAEVLYFEAADKYVRVLTATREYLVRTPLKELSTQLDPQVFWQIHRGTIVRALAIEAVTRDEAGKTSLTLRGLKEKFVVSRLYAHLFKAM